MGGGDEPHRRLWWERSRPATGRRPRTPRNPRTHVNWAYSAIRGVGLRLNRIRATGTSPLHSCGPQLDPRAVLLPSGRQQVAVGRAFGEEGGSEPRAVRVLQCRRHGNHGQRRRHHGGATRRVAPFRVLGRHRQSPNRHDNASSRSTTGCLDPAVRLGRRRRDAGASSPWERRWASLSNEPAPATLERRCFVRVISSQPAGPSPDRGSASGARGVGHRNPGRAATRAAAARDARDARLRRRRWARPRRGQGPVPACGTA